MAAQSFFTCDNAEVHQVIANLSVRGYAGQQFGADPWLLAPRRPTAGRGTDSATDEAGRRGSVVAFRLPPLGRRWLPHRCILHLNRIEASCIFSASRIFLTKAQNPVA